jgi:hypothetical protein
MAVKKPKNITHRINYHVNANKGELKVNFSPSLKRSKLHDHQILVNATLAGTDLALQMLLGTLPVLRPASEAESEVSIYVFKDEERDNKIYKQRKELYDKMVESFEGTLHALFPDIEYIDNCTKIQQETIFDMTKEEAEEHKAMVTEIVEKVRKEKNDEPIKS